MNTALKELLDELTPEQFDEFKADKMLNKIYSMSGDTSIEDIVGNAQAVASAAMLRYLYPRKTGVTVWTGKVETAVAASAAAPTATEGATATAADTPKPAVKKAEPTPEYDLSKPETLPLWLKMKLKKEGKL